MMRFALVLAIVWITSSPAARAQPAVPAERPIVVQGAMGIETSSLAARLAGARTEQIGAWVFWHGTIDGYPVIVSKTLKGMTNAAAATVIAIERFHPIAILNQGTAGGLDASLRLHDIVVGTAAVNTGAYRTPYRGAGTGSNPADWVPLDQTAPDGSTAKERKPARFAADEPLLAAARSVRASHTRGRIVEGAIGSSDMWNDEVDRLLRFNKEFGTMVEEMETASAAQIAAQLGVPFLGIRVVSDNATANIAYDPTTAATCQDYVYEVVKAYIARLRRPSVEHADARSRAPARLRKAS